MFKTLQSGRKKNTVTERVNSVNNHLAKNFSQTDLGPCTNCGTVIYEEDRKECPDCGKQQPLRDSTEKSTKKSCYL